MSLTPAPDNSGYVGEREPDSGSSEFNAHVFLIQQLLGRISTATLVRIVAVTNAGGLSPVGFVDVHPLVNQMDGLRNARPHGVIFGLAYFRLQGGTDAVILDPKEGDIGIAIFADHDISTVKATKDEASPGSNRRFDMADGLYIGGYLNGVPTQYFRFSESGIEVVSPTQITLTAPAVQINSTVTVTGDLTAEGTSVHTHIHNGVKSGSDVSGQPV